MSERSQEHRTDNLQSYLLNGEEVKLTNEQAQMLGAQKIGHSGDLGLEAPAEGALPLDASAHVHADDMPQSPVFNEKDRKLAREVQRSSELSWHQKKGVRIAGAVLAVGAVGSVAAVAMSGDKQPSSVSDVNDTEPVKNALDVNGNQHPELANPEYDKKFGIRELNNDGTIDAAKLFEQVGIVEVPIANSDIGPMTETQDESTEHGREVLGKALDSYLPNFEAIANLYNMNNPEVQMARANSQDISEKQQLLLQNANIQSLLPGALSSFASAENQQQFAPAEIVEAIGSTAPGDASLRAVACPFYGEAPVVCAQAQDQDPNFAKYSSAYDSKGGEIQEVYETLPDGTENRDIRKDIRVGIVWVDAQGNKVSTSEARFTAQIGTLGANGDSSSRYLSFRTE